MYNLPKGLSNSPAHGEVAASEKWCRTPRTGPAGPQPTWDPLRSRRWAIEPVLDWGDEAREDDPRGIPQRLQDEEHNHFGDGVNRLCTWMRVGSQTQLPSGSSTEIWVEVARLNHSSTRSNGANETHRRADTGNPRKPKGDPEYPKFEQKWVADESKRLR